MWAMGIFEAICFLCGWPSLRAPFNWLCEYDVGKDTWERQAYPAREVSREIQASCMWYSQKKIKSKGNQK